MKVTCPNCFGKARISSSNEITPTIRDLYCQCVDVKNCGATFLYRVGFVHYLNPPVKSTQQLAANLIRHLPKDQRAELLQHDLFH